MTTFGPGSPVLNTPALFFFDDNVAELLWARSDVELSCLRSDWKLSGRRSVAISPEEPSEALGAALRSEDTDSATGEVTPRLD